MGQTDVNGNFIYTKGGMDNGPMPYGVSIPYSTALDMVNHRLFVADTGNSRILVFQLTASNTIASTTASYVIGQSSFYVWSVTTYIGSQNVLTGPRSLAYDPTGQRLFVSDASSRILVFNVGTSTIANGENADYVIGQSNFTATSTGVSQNTLHGTPVAGLAYDATNTRLFFSDSQNNRVLVFSVASATLAANGNGENASYVLGQTGFNTSSSLSTTSSSIRSPQGLAYDDANQRLFINDTSDAVDLVFNVATSTIATGEVGSYVLGSSGFGTQGTAAASGGYGTGNGLPCYFPWRHG